MKAESLSELSVPRQEGESYDEYRERLKLYKQMLKQRKRGIVAFKSKNHNDKNAKGETYAKSPKRT